MLPADKVPTSCQMASVEKQIRLRNIQVSYTLRKSKRARQLRLAVRHDGSVVVTAPFRLGQGFIERFVREKTDWLFTKIAYFAQFKGRSIPKYRKKDYAKYKAEAHHVLSERVRYFSSVYGFTVTAVRVKNQKTRWGSCSAKGNLNFNYKLLFLPASVRDYVVVHELCHLREFNHSRKFWDHVAGVIPQYRARRAELRKYRM